MLPCMVVAMLLFALFTPVRQKRMLHLGLVSGRWREAALLLFVMFSAGLAALTLFPADFWSHFMKYLFVAEVRSEGLRWREFYPAWETSLMQLERIQELLRPLEEIKRAFRAGPWFMFMLLGNIGMFIPIGFCVSLLWHKPRWWKAVFIGFLCSTGIEFVQLFIGRRTDIDDVILNTTGAYLGFVLFWILHLLFPVFAAQFQCQTKGESA